jgi:hypothetical protein
MRRLGKALLPEPKMMRRSIYRAACLDKNGRIISRVRLDSSQEVKAIQEAMKLSVKNSYEVWRGSKLIVHIDPKPTRISAE